MEGADIRVPCLRSMAEAEGTMCPLPYSGSCYIDIYLSILMGRREACISSGANPQACLALSIPRMEGVPPLAT